MESRNRRWPSAKRMSKASVLLPEPLTPVTTTNLPRGMASEMFFRLCSRAPWMRTAAAASGCGGRGDFMARRRKSEIRNPKSEGNPKLEVRSPRSEVRSSECEIYGGAPASGPASSVLAVSMQSELPSKPQRREERRGKRLFACSQTSHHSVDQQALAWERSSLRSSRLCGSIQPSRPNSYGLGGSCRAGGRRSGKLRTRGPETLFGFRNSGFFRVSEFGFRISCRISR